MSRDIVALLHDRPELGPALERLGVRQAGGRVYDTAGRLMISVAEPALIAVPGEIERLLGAGPAVTEPVWWVDIRAAADLPEAEQVARRCADELVARHGGTVWGAAG